MILLDTHVLLWLAVEPKKLSKPAARAIRRASRSGGLGIASITLLELAWLFAKGRVRTSGSVSQAVGELIDATGTLVCELDVEIAATAAQLSSAVPQDPADRLIVATALARSSPLVTRDARIQASAACQTIW